MRKTILAALLALAVVLAACTANPPEVKPAPALPTAAPTEPPAEPAPTVAPMAEQATLGGTSWQWVSFTGSGEPTTVDSPASYTISFGEGGLVEIKADCNRAGGAYQTDGDQLSIELGPMTLAACPPESLSDQYLQYLGSAASYSIEGDNLTIELADGGTLLFAPYEATAEVSDPTGLEGTSWEWVYFASPAEEYNVDTPENYTLSFQPAGILEIKADCNNAGGTYEVSDDQLTITIGPMTLAACPEGSLSDQYIQYLGDRGYVRDREWQPVHRPGG